MALTVARLTALALLGAGAALGVVLGQQGHGPLTSAAGASGAAIGIS